MRKLCIWVFVLFLNVPLCFYTFEDAISLLVELLFTKALSKCALCFHSDWKTPIFPMCCACLSSCWPTETWAAAGQGLRMSVFALVLGTVHALQCVMNMRARRGMEGGTWLRLGKVNGWQYCTDRAIKQLKELAQSMSCNSSELCDWLTCHRTLPCCQPFLEKP